MPNRAQTAALLVAALIPTAVRAHAAELKPATVSAFVRYVRTVEQKLGGSLPASRPFLLPDAWAPGRRDRSYEQLRRGEPVIEQIDTFRVPEGLVHHWAGIVFIPGASLQQTLGVIQDYDHHQDIYAPDVERSRLIRRQDDDFHISLRLRKHKVVTTVLDTEYDVHFARLDTHRAYSISRSTRVAEVENPGTGKERELPIGRDHGYLWALDTYWRFMEVEDGVFVQCEAISLTRDVPAGLGWLIGPFIQSIPSESLAFTLTTTRNAVEARLAANVAGSH